MKNPNKIRKIINGMKPENVRPIKCWADLTEQEQETLADDFLCLTSVEFATKIKDSEKKAIMTLSFKEIKEALTLLSLKESLRQGYDCQPDIKHVNLVVNKDDEVLNKPLRIQFDTFLERMVSAMKTDGFVGRLLSNKMQRIRLYHVFEKAKNEIALDPIREQARLDWEEFMKANEDNIKSEEDKLRLIGFMLTTAKT